MKILAIDHGTKFIGLALADTDVIRLALPHAIFANDKDIFHNINKLIHKEKVDSLVVGLPRSLNGHETNQSAIVRSFVQDLAKIIPNSIDIYFQDETLSTAFALEQISIASPRAKSKERVDDQAAAIILQDYLEGI